MLCGEIMFNCWMGLHGLLYVCGILIVIPYLLVFLVLDMWGWGIWKQKDCEVVIVNVYS